MRSNYEEHRENRINGLNAAAERKDAEAQDLFKTARRMSDAIPFGQRPMPGHHSYNRDCNYREKTRNKYRKSFEANERAERLKSRAESAANNHAIFSDDPAAIDKLIKEIASLESNHKYMIDLNNAWKENGAQGLIDAGLSPETAQELVSNIERRWIKRPFPSFSLSNNRQNISRLKKRLERLQREATEETTEQEINGVRIVDSLEDNRTQIFFPDKPPKEIIAELKRNGFRWAPSIGAWQRHRSHAAQYYAEQIIRKYTAQE